MQSNHRTDAAGVCWFFLCTLAAATSGHANTFCVDTPTALRQALTAVSDLGANNDEDNTIKIVRGTYYTEGAEFSFNSTNAHKLDINGGYNSDCSTLLENAALTILDGSGASRVFESESTQGDVSLRFLTFQNGLTPDGEDGGGLLMNDVITYQGPVIVDQNIIRNNHALNNFGGFAISIDGTGTLQFENNLVVDNVADTEFGGGGISDRGGGATLTNNTITQNSATSMPAQHVGGLFLYSAQPENDVMTNNIVWGNAGYDLDTGATLEFNDCGANFIVAINGGGNFVEDPKFAGPGDYRLSADSPLLGMGYISPPGGLPTTDILGLPRQFNGLTDLGAYAHLDEIFRDGFDN
jgi:hypothetical protein